MNDWGGSFMALRDGTAVYSPAARHMHWVTAGIVFCMVPVGLYMTYRGNTLDIWDGLTNALYSGHKLTGLLLLLLVVLRLGYRFKNGAPPSEPSLEGWQKAASHLTHWSLYGLLLAVPLAGWMGISLYPSLGVFGLFNLPGLVSPDQDRAALAFLAHKWLGIVMGLLIVTHISAALFHHLIRKDGVLRRMLPGLSAKS
jgi:cytochrome b561